MKNRKKLYLKLASFLLIALVVFAGQPLPSEARPPAAAAVLDTSKELNKIPKYIFLFIGDGMSFPQITALGHYNGTIENNFTGTVDAPTPDNMPKATMPSFINFPVIGAASTYDASKFITDSASAATAIACGVKTLDGMLGMDAYNNRVESIAETLKTKYGYNVGIISTVSLNHATPAGFYAHVASRNSYYDIGLDLIASNFDFFGGGGLIQLTGKENDKDSLLELAEKAGYNVVGTLEGIDSLNFNSGKTIAINPILDNKSDVAMNYLIDRDEKELGLSVFVQKAIDVMGENAPFFIMTEGGKIDWSCHANDAYTTIQEIKDLEAAVNVAVKFYDRHPNETLIIVTGDHETGGFSMGYGGTGYNTYMALLGRQKISFKKFADDYIAGYREKNTPFETAMKDVKNLFGLTLPNDPDATAAEEASLVLSKSEVLRLKEAYAISMTPYKERKRDLEYKAQYSIYDHEPFQIMITHILNSRAGLGWSTTAHSGLPVAVCAKGVGQSLFGDFYDNTEISKKIKFLVGLN